MFDKVLNTPLHCSTFNVLLPGFIAAYDKSNIRKFEKQEFQLLEYELLKMTVTFKDKDKF